MLRIKRKLSFKVGQREQIDRRLEALGKTIAEEQKRIKCCISVLKNATGLYEKTEYDLSFLVSSGQAVAGCEKVWAGYLNLYRR